MIRNFGNFFKGIEDKLQKAQDKVKSFSDNFSEAQFVAMSTQGFIANSNSLISKDDFEAPHKRDKNKKWLKPTTKVWDMERADEVFSEEKLDQGFDEKFRRRVAKFGKRRKYLQPDIDYIMEFAMMTLKIHFSQYHERKDLEILDKVTKFERNLFFEKKLIWLQITRTESELAEFSIEGLLNGEESSERRKQVSKKIQQLEQYMGFLRLRFCEVIGSDKEKVEKGNANICEIGASFNEMDISVQKSRQNIHKIQNLVELTYLTVKNKKNLKTKKEISLKNLYRVQKKYGAVLKYTQRSANDYPILVIPKLYKVAIVTISSILSELKQQYQQQQQKTKDIKNIEQLGQIEDSPKINNDQYSSLLNLVKRKVEMFYDQLKNSLKNRFHEEIMLQQQLLSPSDKNDNSLAVYQPLNSTKTLKVVVEVYKDINRIQMNLQSKNSMKYLKFRGDKDMIWGDFMEAFDRFVELQKDDKVGARIKAIVDKIWAQNSTDFQ